MAMDGINIESIRELNKLKIYAYNVGTPASGGSLTEINGTSTNILGENGCLYLTSPIGEFTAGVQVGSLMEQFANWVNGSAFGSKVFGSVVSKVIQQQTDSSLAFNFDYNYQFTGTPQFTKKFNCELVTRNDFYEDVAQPLWRLLEWLVPDESVKLADTTNMVEFGRMIETNTDRDGKKLFEREWVSDFAKFLWETSNEYFGGMTFFQIPKQFKQDARLRICIGDWIVLENIILDSVTFDLPYLMYEGGLFDRVGLSLNVKGTRNTSIKTYDWLKNLAYQRRVGELLQGGMMQTQTQTLNQKFKPTVKQR